MDKKAERLEAALRQNLQRRKQQQRGRQETAANPPVREESLEPGTKPD